MTPPRSRCRWAARRAVASPWRATPPEAVVVAAASAEPQIAKFLEGKSVQKVIYVPNRLLNLVLG